MNLHTRLLVADFSHCFRFYRETMGFSIKFGSEEDNYVHFNVPGGGELGLYPREMMAEVLGAQTLPPEARAEDKFALVLDVDDVDAEVNRLAQQGVDFVTEPQNRPLWRERTAHLRDPDGNLIEIKSYIEQ